MIIMRTGKVSTSMLDIANEPTVPRVCVTEYRNLINNVCLKTSKLNYSYIKSDLTIRVEIFYYVLKDSNWHVDRNVQELQSQNEILH